MKGRVLLVVLLSALVPAAAFPQALTSLASVRVGYNTRKNTVKPQGELKAQIDALDAQIAEATRLGRSGELRRLFGKGLALLNNRAWTDDVEYRRRWSFAPTASSPTRPNRTRGASSRSSRRRSRCSGRSQRIYRCARGRRRPPPVNSRRKDRRRS